MKRAVFYVDGFNLYHAVKDLRQDHFKRLDLRALCETFAPTDHFEVKVLYFSAFAKWLPGAFLRHQAYVTALQCTGVKTKMGKFKEKDRRCKLCKREYKAHEEKETDVSIGIHLVQDAILDRFDKAFLITGDSDLVPAIKLAKEHAPTKKITILSPPGRYCSIDLVQAVGGRGLLKKIKPLHLERCLFPKIVVSKDGEKSINRPTEYDPQS